MKNAWNHEIKCKRKGKKDLPAFKDKNLAKIVEENDKKFFGGALAKSEREESLKNFEKAPFEKSNLTFKKTCFTSFDQSKNSLDRSKQREALSIKF